MIKYRSKEEKIIALLFAELMNDERSKRILEEGRVTSSEDATHLSKFYWKMVDKSAIFKKYEICLPFEGSTEYWTEQLYYSLGGYFEKNGFETEWDREIDEE